MDKVRVSDASLTFLDYPDHESHSVIIYFMGCEHNCEMCHNPSFRDLKSEGGVREYDSRELFRYLAYQAERNQTDKIVLSGGDPLHPENFEVCKNLIMHLYYYGFKVAVYTGYDISYVRGVGLTRFEFVKCGVYDHTKSQTFSKDDFKMVLASSNQDFYDKTYNKLSENGVLRFKEEPCLTKTQQPQEHSETLKSQCPIQSSESTESMTK